MYESPPVLNVNGAGMFAKKLVAVIFFVVLVPTSTITKRSLAAIVVASGNAEILTSAASADAGISIKARRIARYFFIKSPPLCREI
jgi:hypothetical protein